MHAATLGPDGLAGLAEDCVREANRVADAIDALDGVSAPVHDRHHFREFQVAVPDADRVARGLRDRGIAVHVVDDDRLQVCVTETNASEADELVAALAEVTA